MIMCLFHLADAANPMRGQSRLYAGWRRKKSGVLHYEKHEKHENETQLCRVVRLFRRSLSSVFVSTGFAGDRCGPGTWSTV